MSRVGRHEGEEDGVKSERARMKRLKRQRQDSNLRLQRRSDFESHALDHSATLSLGYRVRDGVKNGVREEGVRARREEASLERGEGV